MNLTPIHLLLADDDEDDCLFFQDALDELALVSSFKAVHNGEQLLQFLTSHLDELPTVLFLDLNMPRKNGYECLIEIRNHEKLKNLPVIIYSTSFDMDTINLLYQKGAQYYIRKPAEFAKLKELIKQALSLVMESFEAQPSKEKFILQP